LFKRIDHVELIPKDLNQTMDFYTRILGFKLKERIKLGDMPPMDEVVFLTLNDTMIELVSVKNAALNPPWGVGYCGMALQVADMTKTVEFLDNRNVPVTWGPVDVGTQAMEIAV
jgi:glyoxylase I family protein